MPEPVFDLPEEQERILAKLHPIFRDVLMFQDFTLPYEVEGFLYATNSDLILRCPKPGELVDTVMPADPFRRKSYLAAPELGWFDARPLGVSIPANCPSEPEACEECGGGRLACAACGGTGERDCPSCGRADVCLECSGDGYIERAKCGLCDGLGVQWPMGPRVCVGFEIWAVERYLGFLRRWGVRELACDGNRPRGPMHFHVPGSEVDGLVMAVRPPAPGEQDEEVRR